MNLIHSCSQLIPGNFIFAAGETDTLAYLKKGLKIGANRSLTIQVILFMNDLSLPMTLSLSLVHQKAYSETGFSANTFSVDREQIHKNV